jgi:hypothetical protein
MFFILLVSSISVVSQFFKHFTKVEKITIRWIALSDLRTTGPSELYYNILYLCIYTPVNSIIILYCVNRVHCATLITNLLHTPPPARLTAHFRLPFLRPGLDVMRSTALRKQKQYALTRTTRIICPTQS